MNTNNLNDLKMFVNVQKLNDGTISPSEFIDSMKDFIKEKYGNLVDLISEVTIDGTEMELVLDDDTSFNVTISKKLTFLDTIFNELSNLNIKKSTRVVDMPHRYNLILNKLGMNVEELNLSEQVVTKLYDNLDSVATKYAYSSYYLITCLFATIKNNSTYENVNTNRDVLQFIAESDLEVISDMVENGLMFKLLKYNEDNSFKASYWQDSDSHIHLTLQYFLEFDSNLYEFETNFIIDSLSSDSVVVTSKNDDFAIRINEQNIHLDNNFNANGILNSINNHLTSNSFSKSMEEFNQVQKDLLDDIEQQLESQKDNLRLVSMYVNKMTTAISKCLINNYACIVEDIIVTKENELPVYYFTIENNITYYNHRGVKVTQPTEDSYLIELNTNRENDSPNFSVVYDSLDGVTDALIFLTKTFNRSVDINTVITLFNEVTTLPSMAEYKDGNLFKNIPLKDNVIPIKDGINLLTNVNNSGNDDTILLLIKDVDSKEVLFEKPIVTTELNELVVLLNELM